MKYVGKILDFIYPPRCLVCGSWSVADGRLCDECRAGYETVEPPMCPICGRPFESSGNGHECGSCAVKKPPYDILRSAAYYEGSLREAVLRFKFSGRTSLNKFLGEAVLSLYDAEFSSSKVDAIIPVPLHPARLRWRGYNQSLLLASYIGSRRNIRVDPRSLRRVKHTTPQVALTLKQRDLNVRGAFAVSRPESIEGAGVLLVDDVTTTGATLRECAKVLRKAKAANVYALTVARPRI